MMSVDSSKSERKSNARVERALERFDQEYQKACEGIAKNFQRIGVSFQRALRELTAHTTRTVADAEESLRNDGKKRRKRKDADPDRPKKPPTGCEQFLASSPTESSSLMWLMYQICCSLVITVQPWQHRTPPFALRR